MNCIHKIIRVVFGRQNCEVDDRLETKLYLKTLITWIKYGSHQVVFPLRSLGM